MHEIRQKATQQDDMQQPPLPAYEIAGRLNDAISTHPTTIVTAPPGAGKSTVLPLTILESLKAKGGGKIIMIEPRRLAAIQIAARMAATIGEPVGKTVGYRVRFDTKVSETTRIEVLTEGIMTRMLIDDPTLDGTNVVIFDEFHERSLNSDTAFALTRQTQQIIRDDLRIVVMSATIDSSAICHTLHAPLVESKGRMYPVEVEYATPETEICRYSTQDIAQTVAAAITRMHDKHPGDILAFLPGQAEIRRCAELLGSSLSPTTVAPLYGNLTPREQQLAIAASEEGERKVVLATPIAETSITIEGVRIVVDSGLCRKPIFDPRTGLSHLETVRISLDMAEQRKGRAGRVAPGRCLRLWSRQSEHLMLPQREAEIISADFSQTALSIAAFGETDAESLPWLTMPPHANVVKAGLLLRKLGALDDDGRTTPLGRRMATLPCHPRIARMILSAQSDRMRCLAADIAALLEDKDPMANTSDTDISLRIHALRRARTAGRTGKWQRMAQIAKENRKMADAPREDNDDISPEEAATLIACAYPEHIAAAIDNIGTYRLASGDNIRTSPDDSASGHQWLAIASLYSQTGKTGTAFLTAPLDITSVENCGIISEHDNISWDSKSLSLIMRHERRIGRLLLSSKDLPNADRETIRLIICEAVKKDGLSMFAWNDKELLQLQQRVAAVCRWHPELHMPDISTEHLLQNAHTWLPFYLEQEGKMQTSAQMLKKLDLKEIIWSTIPYDLQTATDRIAPTHIQVPTGSRIRLDYRPGSDMPVLSVRLQECFGMTDTPCVDDGKRPVLMELLSPGFKPVQLTKDLRSFWQSAYFEVRKEMRRRYPKHFWPENPSMRKP